MKQYQINLVNDSETCETAAHVKKLTETFQVSFSCLISFLPACSSSKTDHLKPGIHALILSRNRTNFRPKGAHPKIRVCFLTANIILPVSLKNMRQ